MSDYFDSFKLFLYERVSNPLVTAFAFSWVIFNYAFFLMAFSGDDVAIKLSMISNFYSEKDWLSVPNFLGRGSLYPLLSAMFYIFLLPKISIRVVEFHYEQSRILKDAKNKAEGEILVTNKKAIEFRVQQERLEKELEETKSNSSAKLKIYDEQLRSEREAVVQLSKSLKEREKENEGLSDSLSNLEIELKLLAKENDELKSKIKAHKFDQSLLEEKIKEINAELDEDKFYIKSDGLRSKSIPVVNSATDPNVVKTLNNKNALSAALNESLINALNNKNSLSSALDPNVIDVLNNKNALNAIKSAQQYPQDLNILNSVRVGEAYSKFMNSNDLGLVIRNGKESPPSKNEKSVGNAFIRVKDDKEK